MTFHIVSADFVCNACIYIVGCENFDNLLVIMAGFMVISIVNSNQVIVVPKNWIYEIDDNWEKFMNNGLNTTQTFLCYWSSQDGALGEDGVPNHKHKPNFDVNIENNFPCIEGCFHIKLLKYKGM